MKNKKKLSRKRVIKTYVHSVSSGRLLAGVALSQSPVEGVGKAVLAEVGKSVILNLKGRNVGYLAVSIIYYSKKG
jgi:hypothetical protein